MMNIRISSTCISVLLLVTFSHAHTRANTQTDATYSLSDLHNLALNNSLTLKASAHEIEEIIHAGARERRWKNPELGVSGGVRFEGNTTGYEYGISIDQGFYFPGKQQVKRDIARLRQEQARLNREEMAHYIRYDVTNLAFQYAVAMRKLKHIDGRLQRIRLVQAYLAGRKAVSPKHIVERDIIAVKISVLAGHVSDTRNQVHVLYNRLNLYTGIGKRELPAIDVPWYYTAPELDFASAASSLDSSNTGILKRSAAVKRSREEIRLARKESAPDFDIGLYYSEESLGSSRERTAGVGITIPIPVSGEAALAVKEKESRARAEMALLEQSRRETRSRLETLHARFKMAGGMIRTFPLSRLDTIEKSMRYADYEFRKGLIDLATYLEMDSSMHQFIESAYQAQIDMASIHAELLFITGTQ